MLRSHLLLFLFLTAVGCGSQSVSAAEPATFVPPSELRDGQRVVAIGDLHGDFVRTLEAFELAGVLGWGTPEARRKMIASPVASAEETEKFVASLGEIRWSGGDSIVVQVGDQLDRGDGEKKILHFLRVLATRAQKTGGALHIVNGNHETLNVHGNLNYVYPRGLTDFAGFCDADRIETLLVAYEEKLNKKKKFRKDDKKRAAKVAKRREWLETHGGRFLAFQPGNEYARILAERNIVVVVGDAVFVHGGLLPSHVEYGLERLNREVRQWMAGSEPRPEVLNNGNFFEDDSSPVWSRHYSKDDYSEEHDGDPCALWKKTAEMLSEKGQTVHTLVVAHSVQKELNSICNDAIWRIDVGLSSAYQSRRGPAWEQIQILAGVWSERAKTIQFRRLNSK